MFDSTPGDFDGTTILCVIDDDTTSHERLVAVQNGSLRVVEPDTDHGEPRVTASGPLSAWMDLLVHAAAGHPSSHDDLTISGDTATFDALVDALH